MSMLLTGVGSQSRFGILDQVGAPAEVAYGLRKLRAGYTGSAIRVRRSSDSLEADIGFDALGNLNTAALLSHCGAGSGFVSVWFNQSASGAGKEVEQQNVANQPRIVNAGVIETLGGRPAVSFNGSVQWMFNLNSFTDCTHNTTNSVFRSASATGNKTLIRHIASSGGTEVIFRVDANALLYSKATLCGPFGVVGTAASRVATGIGNNGANSQLFLDGSSIGTAAAFGAGNTVGTLSVGAASSAEYFNGLISEIITFQTNLTVAQRQILERNQGNYFGITVA